jgi:tRNA-specific 2-thiouridylase
VADGDHYDLTEELCPDVRKSGDIVDLAGRKVGRHSGIHRYTLGQRRGLGIAAGKPIYVVGLDAKRNLVIVGEKQALQKKTATVKGVRWILGKPPAESFAACTKIRYNHAGAGSRVTPTGPHAAEVEFDESQFAITPGQIAAFYAGEELIGGGWIEE